MTLELLWSWALPHMTQEQRMQALLWHMTSEHCRQVLLSRMTWVLHMQVLPW